MRRIQFGLLCGAAILLAACSSKTDDSTNVGAESAAEQDYFTVRAGPVSPGEIGSVGGNFQMLKVSAANGIPSDGVGGACLVFAAADLGFPQMAAKSCTKHEDCTIGETGNDGMAASAAYCDGKTHSCWAKPKAANAGNALCNRPITMTPTVLNAVPKQPVDVRTFKVKPGAKVRVVACLNKSDIDVTKTGCASTTPTDAVYDLGPVATLR